MSEIIKIRDLKLKIELMENIDNGFLLRLKKAYGGEKRLSYMKQLRDGWKKSKLKEGEREPLYYIKRTSLDLLISAINDFLHDKYQANQYTLTEEDLKNLYFPEFCHRIIHDDKSQSNIFQENSNDGIHGMTDADLKNYINIYAGFYNCWMSWVSPEQKASDYQFIIRIGEQKVFEGEVIIDKDNSINHHNNTIKSYMSTYRHWSDWRKAQGEGYKDNYENYPWWRGEMMRKQGYGYLLWFRFWDEADRYCVISAADRYNKENLELLGLDGLLLAQPRMPSRKAQPACTRVHMENYRDKLETADIVTMLDNIKYLRDGKEIRHHKDKIKNELSPYEILEPYLKS